MELDDPYWIDDIAEVLSFAGLHSPVRMESVRESRNRMASSHFATFRQRFLVRREGSVQFEYCGKWLRERMDLTASSWSPHRLAVALPEVNESFAGLMLAVAAIVITLSFGAAYWLVRLLFFVGFKAPSVFPEVDPADFPEVASNLIVLRVAGPQGQTPLSEMREISYIDSRRVHSASDLSELFLLPRRPVIVDNFDLAYDSEESRGPN